MARQEESAMFHSVEDVQLLAVGISRFAVELYKQQLKRSNGNLFLSPLSISAVLSMAYVGARGNTAAQLKKAMFFEDLEDSKLHQAFADTNRYLRDGKGKYSDEPLFQVFIANRLFAEKSYPFLEKFQTSCRRYYDAESANVDFIGNPSNAAEQINTWVSKSTKGKISEIISSDAIDSCTRLVLLNAIYFKSAWNDQFEPYNTQEADFHVSPSETTKVQMMFRKVKAADYCFSAALQCQILKIPYLYGALSMFILLPDKSSTSLDELEGKLTADHLKSIDDILGYSSGLRFWLPKFKIEAQMELNDVLRDIGIKDLFDEGAADLSGMDNTRLLYASKVVHKAFVDVNEEGTEAAAATFMSIEPLCGRFSSEPPVEFRADHPFLFFIRAESAKAFVFLGRVVKPQSSQ